MPAIQQQLMQQQIMRLLQQHIPNPIQYAPPYIPPPPFNPNTYTIELQILSLQPIISIITTLTIGSQCSIMSGWASLVSIALELAEFTLQCSVQ